MIAGSTMLRCAAANRWIFEDSIGLRGAATKARDQLRQLRAKLGHFQQKSQKSPYNVGTLRTRVIAMKLAFGCLLAVLLAAPRLTGAAQPDVNVAGPGLRPPLWFACCDHGIDQMNALFADGTVIADLKE